MAGVARAMKRHGLTAKPALRLVSTVRSGDVDYYMFDLSDTGRHYTIAKHDFWRGGGTSPCLPQTDLRHALAAVRAALAAVPPAEAGLVADEMRQAAVTGVVAHEAALASPQPPAEPAPEPEATAGLEYVRVRDMQPGDVVSAVNAPKGRHREVIRVVKGAPTYALHYVWEGEAALRTSKHLPGAKFVLRKRAGQ